LSDFNFCPYCGKPFRTFIVDLVNGFHYCPHCGKQLSTVPQQPPTEEEKMKPLSPPLPPPPPQQPLQITVGTKNPGVAALLSFLIAGVGQIYAGRTVRGLLILFGVIILNVILVSISFWLMSVTLIILIWNIYDAHNLCKKYNKHLLETGKPPW